MTLDAHTNTPALCSEPSATAPSDDRCAALLRDLLLANGECAYVLDADLCFTYASEAAEAVFGVKADALVGRSLGDFSVRPIKPDAAGAHVAAANLTGWRVEETDVLRPDGTITRARCTWMATRDASGALTGFMGGARDITAEYKARCDLAASQRRFDEVTEASGECVFEFGPDFCFTYLSRAADELFGAPAHTLIGRSLFDFALPCSPEADKARKARLMQLGVWRAAQHQMLRADGSVAWISTTVRAMQDANGAWAGCRGVIRDISDHMAALEQLDHQSRRLSDIAEVASDFLFEVDAEWRFVWVSNAVGAVTGLGVDAFIGRTPREVFGYEADINTRDYWIRRLEESGGVIRNAELEGGRDSATTGWWTMSLIALRDETGQITGARGSMSNITARKHEQQELIEARNAAEAANIAKAEFLAGISHEIRTPLHAIIGASELLKDAALPPQQDRLVNVTHAAAMHLASVLDDVLDYSKIDAGKLSLEAAPLDPASEVSGVVDMLAAQANAKGLQLELEIAPGTPARVLGDAARLRQIAVNYIGNAIKFTGAGRVTVRLGARDGRIRLAVTDTGIGVPAEQQTRLFDPFTQADASTTRRFGGTGLGLAIVKRLADLMGGEVGVESTVGGGSTFWFEAPLARLVEPEHAAAAPSGANAAAGAAHILVAEDNEANQLLIRLVLAKLGHSCDLAANGVEAVALAARGGHDLVILDRRMPEMDGEEAARRIRALGGRCATIPMIGLTADATEDAQAAFAAAGVPTVLSKPLVIAKLAAAIDAALWIGDAAAERRIA